MRTSTIALAAALASVATSTAAATEQTPFAEFLSALDARQIERASRILSDYGEANLPADGVRRPNPTLAALSGMLILTANRPQLARVYLSRASLDSIPTGLRFRVAMARGSAFERSGLRKEALAAYREAVTQAADQPSRTAATLAVARQLLVEDPQSARQLLDGLPAGDQAEWEFAALSAQIAGLLDQPDARRAAAERAWTYAVRAPARSAAPLRVAALQAASAAVDRDRDREVAMISIANGIAAKPSFQLKSQLPICGEDGVRPDDFVIFAASASPYGSALMPVAASRPQAVAPFFDRIAPFDIFEDRSIAQSVGTSFTVRCRTQVTGHYLAGPLPNPPIVEWLADQGSYPTYSIKYERGEDVDQQVNRLVDRVERYEKRFGTDSAMLIEPRITLLDFLAILQRRGRPVLPGQITDLNDKVVRGLRAAHAPQNVIAEREYEGRAYRLAMSPIDDDTMAAFVKLLGERIANAPARYAHDELATVFDKSDPVLKTQAATAIVANRDRIAAALDPAERKSWLFLVGLAEHELGQKDAGRKTIASAGVPTNSCALSEYEIVSTSFDSADYPQDLVAGENEGFTIFDTGIATTGKVVGWRQILAFPSRLFERESEQGFAGVAYTPPKRANGSTAACVGNIQPINWQLESGDEIEIISDDQPIFPDAV